MPLSRGRPAIAEKIFEVVRIDASQVRRAGVFRTGLPYRSIRAGWLRARALGLGERLSADGHAVQVIEHTSYRRRAPWFSKREPDSEVIYRSPEAPATPARTLRSVWLFPTLG